MKDIVIIGNGGSAMEIYEIILSNLASPMYRTEYRFKGFLGYNLHKENLVANYKQYDLGYHDNYTIQENDVFIIGIGDNQIRMKIYHEFKAQGAKFINIISPYVSCSYEVEIGECNFINLGCCISTGCKIGNCNYFNGEVRIAHNTEIGDGNFFGLRSMVMGNVAIGNLNSIAPTALIMEKTKIGDNNIIAPGAVVYKGCKDNCTMAGNPALIINKD